MHNLIISSYHDPISSHGHTPHMHILSTCLVNTMDCGTSAKGMKKACKNCSCGLAEIEQEEEKAKTKAADSVGVVVNKPVKSSCGSVSGSCH